MGKKRYHVSGLDCPNCAAKFAKDLKKLDGVKSAEVIFASGTIILEGNFISAKLEKIARAHNVNLEEEGLPRSQASMSDSNRENKHKRQIQIMAGLTLVLLLCEWIGSFWVLSLKWLLLPAVIIGGWSNFIKGFNNLRYLRFDSSVLMSVAVIGALFIGQWREAGMVAFLFCISELLENYTAERTRSSIRGLVENAPQKAIRIKGDEQEHIPAEMVEVGDILLVLPGEKVPVDGVVIEGSSFLNQAAITGESLPIAAAPGDTIFSGSINEMGALIIRAERKAADSTMAKIIELVEEAQGRRSTYARFIDRFTALYTPIVMVLAIGVAVLPPLFVGDWHAWIYRGLVLLVISCPCALVITTPVVMVSAIGNAAKNGVLIKGGIWLERLADVKIIAFDKTGTLTVAKPVLTDIWSNNIDKNDLLQTAAAIESLSSHPLALAVCQAAGKIEKSASDYQTLPGFGAKAMVDGKEVMLGNCKLAENIPEEAQIVWNRWENEGKTVSALLQEGSLLGLLAFADSLREEASAALAALRHEGIEQTVVLSGDNQGAVAGAAIACGADAYYGELLPQDKVERISQLKKQGVVMMIGDGINDAPALAAADVSAAMGIAGSFSALDVADMALMSDDLSKLPFAYGLARQSMKIIKQNITFALILKLLVVLAVFPGWLSLWLAIVSDMGANIIVVLNGLRLLRYREKEYIEKSKSEELAISSREG